MPADSATVAAVPDDCAGVGFYEGPRRRQGRAGGGEPPTASRPRRRPSPRGFKKRVLPPVPPAISLLTRRLGRAPGPARRSPVVAGWTRPAAEHLWAVTVPRDPTCRPG